MSTVTSNGKVASSRSSASAATTARDKQFLNAIIRERKQSNRRPVNPRPHETEEEAIIRRFHDAQRMARFRARRKKALEEAAALKNGLQIIEAANLPPSITITPILPNSNSKSSPATSPSDASSSASSSSISAINGYHRHQVVVSPVVKSTAQPVPVTVPMTTQHQSHHQPHHQRRDTNQNKYAKLLEVIERIGQDVRLSYAGSRSSAERLKTEIVKARGLVKDCLVETRINLAQ